MLQSDVQSAKDIYDHYIDELPSKFMAYHAGKTIDAAIDEWAENTVIDDDNLIVPEWQVKAAIKGYILYYLENDEDRFVSIKDTWRKYVGANVSPGEFLTPHLDRLEPIDAALWDLLKEKYAPSWVEGLLHSYLTDWYDKNKGYD